MTGVFVSCDRCVFVSCDRCDSERPVVLPRFVGAGAEEREDALGERVVERVDVDFSINVVERHLQSQEDIKKYLDLEIPIYFW